MTEHQFDFLASGPEPSSFLFLDQNIGIEKRNDSQQNELWFYFKGKAVGQTPACEASEEPRKHCHKSVFCEVGSVVHKSLEQFNGINDRPSCYNFDTSDTDAWRSTLLENLWTVDMFIFDRGIRHPDNARAPSTSQRQSFVYPTQPVPRLWNRLLGSSTWTSFYKRIGVSQHS